jgi:hypothetical protein
MFILRCTQKLQKRLKVSPHTVSAEASQTRLGDWYANLLFIGRQQVVLFTAENSLLPVLVLAKDGSTLMERFRETLVEVLRRLEIPERDLEAELAMMGEYRFASTSTPRGRQVLGSMNDFALALGFDGRPIGDPIRESLWLAETPCGPIGMKSPDEATRGLFELPTKRRVQIPRSAEPAPPPLTELERVRAHLIRARGALDRLEGASTPFVRIAQKAVAATEAAATAAEWLTVLEHQLPLAPGELRVNVRRALSSVMDAARSAADAGHATVEARDKHRAQTVH